MCNHYRSDPDWREKMGDWSETKVRIRFDDTSTTGQNLPAGDVYPLGLGEILMPQGDAVVSAAASWLFMPWKPGLTWAEWSKTRRGCNNARGEEADKKWPFGSSAKQGRCLIPGGAFFEWDDAASKKDGGPGKTEYRFAFPDGRPFFFGGLCNSVEPPDAGRMLTYAMVTKAAGGDTASIGHARQPVILGPDELEAWLDGTQSVAAFTERLDPAGTFALTPVKGPKALAQA